MNKHVVLAVLMSAVCSLSAALPAAASSSAGEESLTVWCWDENFNIAAMKTAEKYYKEAGHENFTLNIVNTAEEDIQTKISTAFSAGVTDDLPDIILMGDSWANMYLQNFEGCFADLTDQIDFSEFAQYKVSCFTVNDRVYGIPFDSGSAGLFYRKDILEAAGYSAEDLENVTWERLVEIGKDIREKTGKYVISFDPNSSCSFVLMDSVMQASGEWFYDASDEEQNADFANNAVVREMSMILKEFWNNDLVYRSESRDASSVGAVQEGEVAFVPNAIWYAPTLMAAKDASGLWDYAPFPVLEEADTSPYTNIGGSSWVILESSKQKELAIDFMKTIWAGNTDFYDDILLNQAAVSTWLPASGSDVYNAPNEFFGGKAIYADFASWGEFIPSVAYGTNTWTVNNAIDSNLIDYFDDVVDLDGLMDNIQATYDSLK